MRIRTQLKSALLAALTAAATFVSFQASPEDIDIFSVDESGIVARPNILIVIDNSANWSQAAEFWPDEREQGKAEVSAISDALEFVTDDVNIGFMEFIPTGTRDEQNSGYLRFHIRPMDKDNKATFRGKLLKIYNDINGTEEKRPAGATYGTLMEDVYRYLAGIEASQLSGGVVPALVDRADTGAYTDGTYKTFKSPLTEIDTCTRTVVIFIANNPKGAATKEDPERNKQALETFALEWAKENGLSDEQQKDFAADALDDIIFQNYKVVTEPKFTTLGLSNSCYTSAAACSTGETNAACTGQGFTSCTCSATDFQACPSNHWTAVGTMTTTTTKVLSDTTTGPATASTGDIVQACKTSGDANKLNPTTCPNDSNNTLPSGTNQTTQTITTWAANSCSYVDIGTSGCQTGRNNYQKQGTRTQRVIVRESTTTTVTEPLPGETAACFTDAASCNTQTGGVSSLSCKDANGVAYTGGCRCDQLGSTTGCSGAGGANRYRVLGNYDQTSATPIEGSFRPPPTPQDGQLMMDEWARFLRQQGVPIPGGAGRSPVTTYTIDTFNASGGNPDISALLSNSARVSGGRYFQAKDKQALREALKQIFTEVQAVNSAFSSASLPVNATNRAQNENQVFIGVFKPDRTKRPLWFGNLKRYQLISNQGVIELGDELKKPAINTQTGFITDCAQSFWTVESAFNGIAYWAKSNIADPPALGKCTSNLTSDFDDLPDGPFVEKGAVAEVIRRGNNQASGARDSDGNFAVVRKVYTRTAATGANTVPPLFTEAAFGSSSTSGLTDTIVRFIRGEDTNDEDLDERFKKDENGDFIKDPITGEYILAVPRARTEPRQSLHGDVVHSRPQPLNFGGDTGVVVFYGANDGHYRAVLAKTGEELWSFVAPEHFNRKLKRLNENNPLVTYPGTSLVGTERKDYFFDGSTGVFQSFNTNGTANKTWIFPTMRRGGRMIYAFDVSTPATPKFMWAQGCNDVGVCTSGFSSIGQTWSLPNVGFVKGYCGISTPCSASDPQRPVIVMGGGYDETDDADTKTPAAASRGRGVYVIDAESGALVKSFDFSSISGARGVAADVAMIDVNNDKMVDYVYAVDTGGNVYRMDFVDTSKNPLTKDNWIFSRVAYTDGDYRKFLFAPAIVQTSPTDVYVAVGSGDREHPLITQYPYGVVEVKEDLSATPPVAYVAPVDPVVNRFYVYRDRLSDVSALTVVDLDDPAQMEDYTTDPGCASKGLATSAKNGWFMNLQAQGRGEQVVTSAVIAAGFVFFSTNRPSAALGSACTASLGEARGYFLNLFNASGAVGVTGACDGDRSSIFVGGGLPPSPVLATVPIEGVGLRTVVIGAVQKTGEPSSPIEAQRVRPPIPSDRTPIYWYKSTGDK